MLEFDIHKITKDYPFSVWSVYILGFILTYLDIFNSIQFNSLLISATITIFILAPIAEWESSIKRTLLIFPFPLLVAYGMWIINFIAIKSPLPSLMDHFSLFFLPLSVGVIILFMWGTVNKAFQELLLRFNRSKYWSGLVASGFLIGLSLLLILSFSLYAITMGLGVNATIGGV